MKPIKRKCPICHMPIKVSQVKTIDDIKIRKLYCKKCQLSIRTIQVADTDEFINETWTTGKYTTKLEDKVRIFSGGQLEVVKVDGTYNSFKLKDVM